MKLSYTVNGQNLIQSAFLPLERGQVYLITGAENLSFNLLGGIIGKLLPLNERLGWPQLDALISPYTGELLMEEGTLPESSVYVGADPERHLLFSKVKEEIIVQADCKSDFTAILSIFDFDKSFLERPISALSGGEKMKLSLAIALSLSSICYVFHGVMPWLDKKGRSQLIEQTNRLRNAGSLIIFLEHEYYPIREIINRFFFFDGKTISEVQCENDFSYPLRTELEKCAASLSTHLNGSTNSVPILKFGRVTLHEHPYFGLHKAEPLLNSISFSLHEKNSYFLIGDNGGGKSTIAQIAFRVIKPDSGVIDFCGRPLSSYSRSELTQMICYVSQFPERQITLSNIAQYKSKARKQSNNLSLGLMDKYLNLTDNYSVSQLSYLEMKR